MKVIENSNLLNNLKVLYIEDEDFARNELAIFLKRRVGVLLTAKNGEEGLKTFNENRPDLVLTDLIMPVMGGIQLIDEIRKTGSSCPVIVISALSDSQTIIKTIDQGIVKYIIKPLNTNELIKHMEGLAIDILRDIMGNTVIGGLSLLNKESKQALEKKLKSEIAFFLKSFTGKGPRDIHLFIKGNRIEVKALGVLTLLESNIVLYKKNYSLVDYNRKIFYEENISHLQLKLGEVVGSVVQLLEIISDSCNNSDEMIFTIF
ncbi:response regulator [Clostridium sp. CF012]|nr:response regulator [Clostridium sp. CF012]